jgi:uncharacterized protein YwqG
MAIGLKFEKSNQPLTGLSKWWGAPDLPEDWDYPCSEEGNPLTFVCQIRCEDIAELDTEGLLPHTGMLYFFAQIGEYVHSMDIAEGEHNGLGEWGEDAYKVLYSPSCDDLDPFEIIYDDGEPAYLEAEAISFTQVSELHDSFKLLGRPYYDEVTEQYEDSVCLLQIDENDDWGMTLYDCGMICFMITPEQLKAQQWDEVKVYFHSF